MEENLHKACMDALERRGVIFLEMSKILYDIQVAYNPNLTLEECLEHIYRVLDKREVQYAVLTGVAIDELAEKNLLPQPLQDVIARDEGLYGIDEILALSICNVYGSIGLTNFGFLDKTKPGIIGRFNNKDSGEIHTFLDDIVSAIIAAAASRLAHKNAK
jgi:phosphatidylglycerophosphatase A